MSMSPGEIAWRVSNLVRDKVDRALQPRRARAFDSPAQETNHAITAIERRQPLIAAGRFDASWVAALIAEADHILSHRVRLLGSRRVEIGTPIRWNYEHNKNAPTPTGYAGDIDYRDYAETGDCKWVWELNRHHHLVVLGRAFRATGNVAYAREVVEQMLSWIDACPFGTGMNWRSPLELSIRLINWVFALESIEDAGVIDAEARARIERSIYQHLWDVSRKYSRFSSANNHLIGEAAGVYVAASRFPHLRNATKWRATAKRILLDEIGKQVDDDGVHRELATGYQVFVLQFFMIAALTGERSGDAFPAAYQQRLAKMADFLAALSEGGAPMLLFNDCDDGYVLDLGDERGSAGPWIDAVNALIGERDAANESETCFWLFGGSTKQQTKRRDDVVARRRALRSQAFTESGIYLLQCGAAAGRDRISVAVDAGPLGYRSIAAHGHADALSLTLRAFGVDFLIDPGTYDYFTYADWRDYFRTTRAHNTVEIDGMDQSEMLGKFLWGRRANSRCIEWKAGDRGATLVAEHDGYSRLADPVIHRRSVSLNATERSVRINDEFNAAAAHRFAAHWHFAPSCRVERISDATIRATRDEGTIELTAPAGTTIELFRGETAPILGWCSRAYHEKTPITTVRFSGTFDGRAMLETTVQISPSESDA